MSDESMSYAGFCPICGAMRATTVDLPEDQEDVAKDVAEFIASGLQVQRITSEQVRQGFNAHTCHLYQDKPEEEDPNQPNLL